MMLQAQPQVASASTLATAPDESTARIRIGRRRRRRPPSESSSSSWGGLRMGLTAVLAVSVFGRQGTQAFLLPAPLWGPTTRSSSSSSSIQNSDTNTYSNTGMASCSSSFSFLVSIVPSTRALPSSPFLLYATSSTSPPPSNTNPRERLYNLVNDLHAHRDAGHKDGVLSTVQSILEDRALDLSPKHCTMLVSALGAVGLSRETVTALQEMKDRGLSLNKVTYGAVVNACAYGKDMAAARRVMEEMRSAGVMPDAVEYSNLLHGYKRLNATEECLACFDEMLFYGVKPSTRTYDGVLGALAAAERWQVFKMYLDRMQKEGVRLSAITYGWAVRGAERAQDWGEVLSMFRALQTEHYHPTASTCHSALKASLALNDLDTAVAAMTTLLREGWTMGRTVYATLQLRLLVGGMWTCLEN